MHHSTFAKISFLSAAVLLAACTPTGPGNQNSSSSAASSVASSQTAQSSSANGLIFVTSPNANAVVQSPLVVRGEARGNWYFEASFPVRLYDGNGVEIAVTPAQALSDWMTTDFVPFEATLTFTPPATSTGTLVLEKDNPSGLPENADSISIPVQF